MTQPIYLEHFALLERPFSNAPDPRFVYLGAQRERALAHLLRGIQDDRGVVHLTGESGSGKTTVCRVLVHRLPENVDVALILNPVLTRAELLAAVCDELGVASAENASGSALRAALHGRLQAHAAGHRAVLIVDDAHNLGPEALEELRSLSSLGTEARKLLQIILIGEPGLIEPLGRLTPSVAAGYHLLAFSEAETCEYIRHRLAVAGGVRDIFDVEALRDVHHLSGGVPSLINAICDRALLSAVVQQRHRVDRLSARAAARVALAPPGSRAPEPVEPAPRVRPAPRVEPTLRAEPGPRAEPARRGRRPRAAPARARRPQWPWLVGGGLALNAAVIGAVFVVSRPPDAGGPPPAVVATAEPPAKIATQDVQTTPAPVDRPDVARRPDPAPPMTAPVVPAPANPPPRAQPTLPAPSYVPERYSPVPDTARQRRQARATRGALWSATSPPVSNFEPEPPEPESAELKVDLLVWALDPRERMVFLNGRKYVEGQRLENGALIERIDEDGIVLLQGGRRVRLPSEAR